MVGNTAKGTINVNYKVIMEVLAEVYFEVITRRSATFIRSQIASQLGTPSISEKKHTTDFARAHKTLEVIKSL